MSQERNDFAVIPGSTTACMTDSAQVQRAFFRSSGARLESGVEITGAVLAQNASRTAGDIRKRETASGNGDRRDANSRSRSDAVNALQSSRGKNLRPPGWS